MLHTHLPPALSLPKITAHRGGKFWEGDNFSYVSDSVRQGAQIIELDIGGFQDGRYIVRHDRFSRPQGYLDDALPHLAETALYLDIKDRTVNVDQLVSHVRQLCSNRLIIGSFDPNLLRTIEYPNVERNYHCIAPWKAVASGQAAEAHWITPLHYFVTEHNAQQVRQAGFKFVPNGSPFLKRHEIVETQLNYVRWGAYALFAYDVERMAKFLRANS